VVQLAAARALGKVGNPSAVMPLYEVAGDPAKDQALRRVATRSLEQLGFERREDDGPPAILAWVAGLATIVGSLVLATVIGQWALVPLLGGVALIVAYYVHEARKARAGEWYVDSDGGEYWIPGDAHAESAGWLADLFGGGGDGGGGNGGGS
jgi:HEAT repeat protein